MYFVPPRTFCLASKESSTPSQRAVSGMSCMTPCAPRLETAAELKLDSRNAIAATRLGSTRYFALASAIAWPRYFGTGIGKAFVARRGGIMPARMSATACLPLVCEGAAANSGEPAASKVTPTAMTRKFKTFVSCSGSAIPIARSSYEVWQARQPVSHAQIVRSTYENGYVEDWIPTVEAGVFRC